MSALVMVDDNHELDENSFKFLLEILQRDLEKLPSKVLCYRDWYLQNDLPISSWQVWGKVANMAKLSELYNENLRLGKTRLTL